MAIKQRMAFVVNLWHTEYGAFDDHNLPSNPFNYTKFLSFPIIDYESHPNVSSTAETGNFAFYIA